MQCRQTVRGCHVSASANHTPGRYKAKTTPINWHFIKVVCMREYMIGYLGKLAWLCCFVTCKYQHEKES